MKYVDPDGNTDDVYFYVIRNEDSILSTNDKKYRGLDVLVFQNYLTDDIVAIYGVQTYVSNIEYPIANTLSGNICFGIQYLGDNEPNGASLYGGSSSSYQGPIFNIVLAITDKNGRTNMQGIIMESDDHDPFRIHSNKKLSGKEVPLASGGCIMYEESCIQDLSSFISDNNIQPGDIIWGYIKEKIEP